MVGAHITSMSEADRACLAEHFRWFNHGAKSRTPQIAPSGRAPAT
jgi:hypothetical protein